MKVELALLSLILIVSCSAQKYELKCTEKELGIMWPIYEDNELYSRCVAVGQAVDMKCNSGTKFTFVYQSCTLPEDYIPPPPLNNLPTDVPPTPCEDTTPATPSSTASTASTEPPLTLPTPQHPPPGPPPTEKPTTLSTTTTSTTPAPPSSTTTTIPPTAPGPPTGGTPAPPTGNPPSPPTGGPPGPPTGGPPTPPRPTAGPGVPGPPSPPATGVPMPNTPAPTPPVIDNTPPSVGVTLPSNS